MSKNKLIIGGVLLVSLLFAGAVWWWDNADMSPAAPVPSAKPAVQSKQAKQAKPATPASTTLSAQQQAQQHPQSAETSPSGKTVSAPKLPSAGNLGILTVNRAQLSEAKLAADIEEQNARLRKAQGMTMPTPVMVSSVRTPEADLLLPDLSTPSKPASSTAAQPDCVVGVQGIDGKLTATIRSKGKLITVRPGQAYAGGVISAISREGVSIRQGGSTRALPFE